MYTKKFIIRWADLDANGHLAHSSYQKITADARLSLFYEKGTSITEVLKKGIGSVIFYEQIFYFKEFLYAEEAYVNVEVIGLSEKCDFFKFEHRIYKKDGTHAYTSEVLGSWIDLNIRKLILPPIEIVEILRNIEKGKKFQTLTKKDIRVNGIRPENINAFWKE